MRNALVEPIHQRLEVDFNVMRPVVKGLLGDKTTVALIARQVGDRSATLAQYCAELGRVVPASKGSPVDVDPVDGFLALPHACTLLWTHELLYIG